MSGGRGQAVPWPPAKRAVPREAAPGTHQSAKSRRTPARAGAASRPRSSAQPQGPARRRPRRRRCWCAFDTVRLPPKRPLCATNTLTLRAPVGGQCYHSCRVTPADFWTKPRNRHPELVTSLGFLALAIWSAVGRCEVTLCTTLQAPLSRSPMWSRGCSCNSQRPSRHWPAPCHCLSSGYRPYHGHNR